MILSEAQVLEFRLEMEALICERQGMVATNLERERNGLSLAYTEEGFENMAKRFRKLHENMIFLMEK